jgi:hypothetical protein
MLMYTNMDTASADATAVSASDLQSAARACSLLAESRLLTVCVLACVMEGRLLLDALVVLGGAPRGASRSTLASTLHTKSSP